MKRIIRLIMIFSMALSLVACSSEEKIVISDPVLSRMISEVIDIPEGKITTKDALEVTELDLQIPWQAQIPLDQQIQDISGLKYFTNLTQLDLSFHAVNDISVLKDLTQLESLSLGGNRIADLTPLANLDKLVWLALFNCEAQDYSPLANLTQLEYLSLDRSTVNDLAFIENMTNLKQLSLTNTQITDITLLANLSQLEVLKIAETPIVDFSSLAEIYDQLTEKDFVMIKSLSQLGFKMSNDNVFAEYNNDTISVKVNHEAWGTPAMESEGNSVRLDLSYPNNQRLAVIYYPAIMFYAISFHNEEGMALNYLYDVNNNEIMYDRGDEATAESLYSEVLGDIVDKEGVLAPIPAFNQTISDTLGVSADMLFNLPFNQ